MKGVYESYLDAKKWKRMPALDLPPELTAVTERAADQSYRAIRDVKHVYEFGTLLADLWENDTDTLQALIDEGFDLLEQGAFHLPFPEVCYTIYQQAPDGPLIDTIIYLTESPADQRAAGFTLAIAMKTLQGNWCAVPMLIDCAADEIRMVNGTNIPDEGNYEFLSLAILATQLILNNATVYEDTADQASTMRQHNKLRRALGKKPLPTTLHVVTHINEVKVLPRPQHGATGHGSPREPHDRHGHWRRKFDKDGQPTGEKIWIRDAKIHGGKAATVAHVIHEVKE
jgi:hypothetical protein